MSVNGIKITDVIVFPTKTTNLKSKIKAFAKVILNDQFTISGIRVIEGIHGPFIGFPQEYNKDDSKHYDICFPTTSELRSYISSQILDQYSQTLNLMAHA